MSRHCGHCGASGENFLCRECMITLAGWVDDLVGVERRLRSGFFEPMRLLAELAVTASRQDRMDGMGPALYSTKHCEIAPAPPERLPPFLRSRAGAEALVATPWPLAWDAASLAEDARTTLAALARLLAVRVGSAPVLPLSAWFAGNLSQLAFDADAAEWFHDIEWLHQAVLTAIDRRDPEQFAGTCTEPDAHWVITGPMPGPVCGPFTLDCAHESCELIRAKATIELMNPGACGADLYYRNDDAHVRCAKCGAVYDVAAMKENLIAAVDDQIDTATAIANALTGLLQEVTPSMIRQMAYRGQIVARGVAADGISKRYRVGDVVRVLNARAARAAAR